MIIVLFLLLFVNNLCQTNQKVKPFLIFNDRATRETKLRKP